MRKILSLLGAMALSTTASANVIACDKKEEPKLIKTDLSTILQLTGLHLVANPIKKFKDFNSEILTAKEFENKKTSVDDYIINFYYMNDETNLINNENQFDSNDIYVKIQATQNNPYWNGTTNLIKIEVFYS